MNRDFYVIVVENSSLRYKEMVATLEEEIKTIAERTLKNHWKDKFASNSPKGNANGETFTEQVAAVTSVVSSKSRF